MDVTDANRERAPRTACRGVPPDISGAATSCSPALARKARRDLRKRGRNHDAHAGLAGSASRLLAVPSTCSPVGGTEYGCRRPHRGGPSHRVALRRTRNNRLAPARELGVHKSTLFREIRALGLLLPDADGRSARGRRRKSHIRDQRITLSREAATIRSRSQTALSRYSLKNKNILCRNGRPRVARSMPLR